MRHTYSPKKREDMPELTYNAAFIWFNRTTLIAVYDDNYITLARKVDAVISAYGRKYPGAHVHIDWENI